MSNEANLVSFRLDPPPKTLVNIAPDGTVMWPNDIGPADIIGQEWLDSGTTLGLLALWYATHPQP